MSGYVTARMDYTAYGEDIGAGTGLRTLAQGFTGSNDPRQQYAMTERDEAVGLDHTPWREHDGMLASITLLGAKATVCKVRRAFDPT
ncbi:MAG: hypothetical protein LC113_13065 [Acidobacteria bacterium]|nr:hypothetical protein [Acidobacteriota bacterium]